MALQKRQAIYSFPPWLSSCSHHSPNSRSDKLQCSVKSSVTRIFPREHMMFQERGHFTKFKRLFRESFRRERHFWRRNHRLIFMYFQYPLYAVRNIIIATKNEKLIRTYTSRPNKSPRPLVTLLSVNKVILFSIYLKSKVLIREMFRTGIYICEAMQLEVQFSKGAHAKTSC